MNDFRVRKLCIATWELKGFTPGGIGVLVHNILRFYGNDPRAEISILWYGSNELDPKLFGATYPNCKLFSAREWAAKDDPHSVGLPDVYVVESQRQSMMLMQALKTLESEKGSFDFVEFPDFDGPAFASLQEKRLGRAFQKTVIAIRLHSTEAVLRAPDHRPMNPANAVRADIERKALRDADLVIGHLQPIVDDVADFFAFESGWRGQAIVEHPPVFIESSRSGSEFSLDVDTPIILPSKIQWCKRPATFINGVLGFMQSHPDYRGDAYLLAHVTDGELRRHCLDLIPSEYTARIKLLDNVPNALREEMISGSITVVPSSYESFCLAAYEASYLGALVVLNEANAAFGEDTPWRNGENCVKFDGTANGLALSLASMWRHRSSFKLSTVELSPPKSPYWVASGLSSPTAESVDKLSLSASAIVFSSDAYGDPLETVASLMLVSGVDLEIILVTDRPSRIAGREEVLSRLRESPLLSSGNLKIISLGFDGGEAALINAGMLHCTRDMVVIVRAGAKLSADYVRDSLYALGRSDEYDIAVSQCVRSDHMSYEDSSRIVGEALNSMSWRNLFGGFEMVARREVIERLGFDESLDRFVDWDFHIRACMEGIRYIVANEIGVHIDLAGSRQKQNYRSHFDNILSKHGAIFPGGKVPLVSIFEGNIGQGVISSPQERLFFKRPLSYYTSETTPWWRLALRRPFRLPRWLLLREFQRRPFY